MPSSLQISPEFKQKSIRSYVVRAGRITTSQKRAFDSAWAAYGLSLHAGKINPQLLFERIAPITVEIGFGMGDSLLSMMESDPDTDFIGIEVHPPGVGRLIHNANQRGLKNLKVYMADAVDVIADCLPNDSVSRFHIFFPDPWHKKKHHKRRLIQADFLSLLLGKLKGGGRIHLATDWQEYAEHMMQVLSAEKSLRNCCGNQQYAKDTTRPKTKFESRGDRLGHSVWDLMFEKIPDQSV